jgi:hypothetical protein
MRLGLAGRLILLGVEAVRREAILKEVCLHHCEQPVTLELVGFRMRALQFGSVPSVHAFLRISNSLWYVLVRKFRVLLTNYFDDFVAAAPLSECNSITSCVHMYFKLSWLGFLRVW